MIIRDCFRILLIFACITGSISAAELGNVTIPKDGVLGGRSVKAGPYKLEIDDSADKPYLRLIRNRTMIAADVAIVLPARGSGKTAVALTKVGGKELIRIQARHMDFWYFVYIHVGKE